MSEASHPEVRTTHRGRGTPKQAVIARGPDAPDFEVRVTVSHGVVTCDLLPVPRPRPSRHP